MLVSGHGRSKQVFYLMACPLATVVTRIRAPVPGSTLDLHFLNASLATSKKYKISGSWSAILIVRRPSPHSWAHYLPVLEYCDFVICPAFKITVVPLSTISDPYQGHWDISNVNDQPGPGAVAFACFAWDQLEKNSETLQGVDDKLDSKLNATQEANEKADQEAKQAFRVVFSILTLGAGGSERP
ncbi:hypothetical protein EJ05DRAFT_499067 [Pseudovirgaria hyperparasitica]|uniref:Uncharacterized protein n=1 Tax=Pseudovirgaria hyperparasitica TaxID=470096 RepID=A0A6A6WCU6_9PEZI|nr:uncharacterized protein EJ05DRAFT_499067 [Pseudovirgaria hyperparasitica]KAF2759874.1 hypothetical protein EJ05DRAFT_499067 [Pseudovirgaria hyperparasitica]